jgi:hypothetical protein
MMFVLVSFLAFSIDTGYLAQTRAEMRRAADAAAMAGCWELYEQMEQGVSAESSHNSVRQSSAAMAALNPICRSNPTLDTSCCSQDVQIGYVSSTRSAAISNDSSKPYFAVKAKVSRTASKNGEVPYFFGKIFGDGGIAMETEATAVMGRQISGFRTPTSAAEKIDLLPFALDKLTWDRLCEGDAPDCYSCDANGVVTAIPDGVKEVNLYPQGTGSPGNRGTVDIGGSNNSTKDIARQILEGISDEDVQDLFDATEQTLSLHQCDLGPLMLNGDTGISAGVKDELASIIGEKRIIPIFESVSGNGNNAEYKIVKWAGVKILKVKLTGSMSKKEVIVQPCHVICNTGIIATEGTEWSDFVLSPVLLAR